MQRAGGYTHLDHDGSLVFVKGIIMQVVVVAESASGEVDGGEQS